MTSKRCHRCGLVNFAGTAECRRCNAVIAWGEAGVASQPAFSAGGGDSQRQPFRAAPSLPNYGVGYASPYAQTTTLRSGLAKSSLVLGILGLFSGGLILVGSIIGLITGIRAAVKAGREPYVYGGSGIAIGGIVTNSLGIVSFVPWAAIVAALVLPTLMQSRTAANEASAIGTLNTIVTAEADLSRSADHRGRYGTIEELVTNGLIDRDWPFKNGYQFKLRLLDRNGNFVGAGSSDAIRFEAVATPDVYGSTGRRSFYTCDDFVIRCADRKGNEAIHSDPDLDHYVDDSNPTSSDKAPRRRD